jgi:hypothetical protein
VKPCRGVKFLFSLLFHFVVRIRFLSNDIGDEYGPGSGKLLRKVTRQIGDSWLSGMEDAGELVPRYKKNSESESTSGKFMNCKKKS